MICSITIDIGGKLEVFPLDEDSIAEHLISMMKDRAGHAVSRVVRGKCSQMCGTTLKSGTACE